MHFYRLNAVGRDGRVLEIGTANSSNQALLKIRDMLDEFPRAWVTDEEDLDVSLPDLMRRAEAERDG